jgi:Protein of unknown function (DUF732)
LEGTNLMTRTQLRPWITAGVCVILVAAALIGLNAGAAPAGSPTLSLDRAGSATTTDLTVMPPPAAAPAPTTEPPAEFTPAELRYLQLLHDQTEFEAEYASDASMVLIGHGLCAGRDLGESVPQQIDYLDQRGYTSLAAGWIVGSALQELCAPGGGH